jgi:hypothetical protein
LDFMYLNIYNYLYIVATDDSYWWYDLLFLTYKYLYILSDSLVIVLNNTTDDIINLRNMSCNILTNLFNILINK